MARFVAKSDFVNFEKVRFEVSKTDCVKLGKSCFENVEKLFSKLFLSESNVEIADLRQQEFPKGKSRAET